MGLQSIDDFGNIRWLCPQGKKRGCPTHLANIKDDIQWVDASCISLPPCSNCGSTMVLKVATDEERKEAENANMQEYGMVPTQMEVPHAITGAMIPVMIPALRAIGGNPWHARNDELSRQLQAVGKRPLENAP